MTADRALTLDIVPTRLVPIGILLTTAVVYFKALAGDFVWDDIVCLSNQPWMLADGAWRDFFAHDYCGIPNYFRPLATALFMLEMRLSNAHPAPMHAVSLALHLLNCLLVWRLALALRMTSRITPLLAALAMLLYALHPILIEPIAWISAQTELTVNFFMLCALLANHRIAAAVPRAVAVAACFLMAALCKESAVALPFAIAVCDWAMRTTERESARARIRSFLQRNWTTYAAMLVAGAVYLALRQAQLGYVLRTHTTESLGGLARFQEICALYLTYWRLIVWPMAGLSPVHLLDETAIGSVTMASLATDVIAGALAAYALFALWRRKASGILIAGASVLMLPVLHLLPVAFDESVYHDRYLMTPLAFAAAALPNLLAPFFSSSRLRALKVGVGLAIAGWIGIALVNIQVTVPLWSSSTLLWRWALQSEPQSISARENLFGSYVMRNDPEATPFARKLVDDPSLCSICLLNVAYYGLLKRDADLVEKALDRLQSTGSPGFDLHELTAERIAVGRLLELRQDPRQAEAVYGAAADASPNDPEPGLSLALLLAREGRLSDADAAADRALARLPPDQRSERRREFEQERRDAKDVPP